MLELCGDTKASTTAPHNHHTVLLHLLFGQGLLSEPQEAKAALTVRRQA